MQLLSNAPSVQGVARLLAALGPRLSKTVRRQVRPQAGLSMPQFGALRALSHGPRSSGALAQSFGVSRPTITRMVDGLVKKGLVDRQADPSDRRVSVISLTAAGLALQESTEEAAERVLADLLVDLPPERLTRLEAALSDLVDLLDRDDAAPTDRRHNS